MLQYCLAFKLPFPLLSARRPPHPQEHQPFASQGHSAADYDDRISNVPPASGLFVRPRRMTSWNAQALYCQAHDRRKLKFLHISSRPSYWRACSRRRYTWPIIPPPSLQNWRRRNVSLYSRLQFSSGSFLAKVSALRHTVLLKERVHQILLFLPGVHLAASGHETDAPST